MARSISHSVDIFVFVVLLLVQDSSPLQRFQAAPEPYAKMRVVSEALQGKIVASADQITELLAAAMKDPDAGVRRQAVGSVAGIRQLNAMPSVPESQQWARSLREVGETLAPALDAALTDPDAVVRREALRGIFGPAALADPNKPLAAALVRRLAAIFDHDPSGDVRGYIVTGLGSSYTSTDPEVGGPAKHVLLRALEDPDPYVVQFAGSASYDARYPEALPLLIKQVNNRSPVARMGVAAGLQAYTIEARPYLDLLERALAAEPEGPTRKTLEATINRIKSGR